MPASSSSSSSARLDPLIVYPAPPGTELRCALFATNTDCLLVGDSGGAVSVYRLQNVSKATDNQVNPTNGQLLTGELASLCWNY